jgi:acetate kinase
MVRSGRAGALMKGHLHTDELLHHVVKRDGGLRTGRRLSHIFVMDVPGLDHLLMITDAAINIAPDLRTKVDIVQNAIDLGQALGIARPRVGVLAAVETVNEKMPATLDAAVLSKMADRGQIKGGCVDGPLAMDNALSMAAARTKGIAGEVAGRAEVLVAPDIQSGNMIAKQLTYLAHAEAAGLVMGASVPIILTSRADDEKARLASCAVAALYAGQVEGIGVAPHIFARDNTGVVIADETYQAGGGHAGALARVMDLLDHAFDGTDVRVVGHRVVHGGAEFSAPVVLDEGKLEALEAYTAFAPLHQPHNLAAIRAAMAHFPQARQVACFDTAFHRGQPFVADTYALPRSYYDRGVRRYGFHGLSYTYIAGALMGIAPKVAMGRVVIAHLGNGASMAAMAGGEPMGSTLGFTAVDGLPMGTRSGQIDPGVVLWLIEDQGMSTAQVTDLLYKQSGLKGMSGVSSDMRALLESDVPEAAEAVAYFCHRIRREIGAMAASMGGLDAVVFTAGIGEHADAVRASVCQGLAFLGITLDAERNRRHDTVISTEGSGVQVLVIPTNEEIVIARAAASFL